MADAAIRRWPAEKFAPPHGARVFNDQSGTLLSGMNAVWYNTAGRSYYQYIQDSIDPFLASGAASDPAAFSLHSVMPGRQLLLLYRTTLDKRYYEAAAALRRRVSLPPASESSGSVEMQDFPDPARPDELYLAEPFLAEYASVFHQPQDFAGITRQFLAIEQQAHRDPESGLLYRAWDRSRQGTSPTLWAQGLGWYMMALVDSVPLYPEDDPGRAQLIDILKRTAAVVVRYQDAGSGLWYQVLDQHEKGIGFGSSAACMFTYVLAKGVRLGYLPPEYANSAQHAWSSIRSRFLTTGPDGQPTLANTANANGPTHEINNDPQDAGSFLLAATEMEHAADAKIGQGSSVLLDAWYNSQTRDNAAGQKVLFHYKWDDFSNSGYSLFGHIFRVFGMRTETLPSAPTRENLKGARVYVIVSPDNPSKTPQPHYMNQDDAREIAAWVKQGGVLVIMENDPDNADITHMDALADIFGLHFNNVLTHHVIGDQFEMGRMDLPRPAAPFTSPHVLYMKDTCSLSLSRGAVALLEWKDDTMMAAAHYGKGTVVAVTDPWLYNEYTDGRKLPPDYDNFAAGREFVHWLLQQP